MPLLDDIHQAMVLTAKIRDDLEPDGPSELFRLALEASAALTDLAEALGGLS